MKSLRNALIFLLIVVVIVGPIVLLKSFDLLPSTENARDWVIIIYGVMGILFFTVLIGILLAILWLFNSLRGSLTNLIDESVRPTLNEVQRTAENVRGTSEFIADSAVNPVIRVVAITRGIRRGISAIRPRRK